MRFYCQSNLIVFKIFIFFLSFSANWRTPDYAADYKSPYQQTTKIIKPGETAEEKRKRETEEENRKKMNELAFKAWLKQKDEKKFQEARILKINQKLNEQSITNVG